MFDPQRVCKRSYRSISRKGQVIQKKRVDVPIAIENRLIPIYKNYFLKNNILAIPTTPAEEEEEQPQPTVKPVATKVHTDYGDINLITGTSRTASDTTVNVPSNWGYLIIRYTDSTLATVQQITLGYFLNVGNSVDVEVPAYSRYTRFLMGNGGIINIYFKTVDDTTCAEYVLRADGLGDVTFPYDELPFTIISE